MRLEIMKEKAANSGNGIAQTNELVSIELIGPAKVMDDPRCRVAGDRMTLVVRRLIVLDGVAVSVFSLDSAQIHNTCVFGEYYHLQPSKYIANYRFFLKIQI